MFCGRLATIGLCPVNPGTNIQQPAATWDVTKAFYSIGATHYSLESDDGYHGELHQSLSRLESRKGAIDQWKSCCLNLQVSWEKHIMPYWRDGFRRAFVDKKDEYIRDWVAGGELSFLSRVHPARVRNHFLLMLTVNSSLQQSNAQYSVTLGPDVPTHH